MWNYFIYFVEIYEFHLNNKKAFINGENKRINGINLFT